MRLIERYRRKANTLLVVPLVIGSLASSAILPSNTYATSCRDDADFQSRNDVLFYSCISTTPCSTGSGNISGPAPTSLSGSTNAEKVWNYFTDRGLTPVAAAGAMGNIEQESSFDPWAGEGGNASIDKSLTGVGFGLIQWTNTGGNSEGRRYGVMNYLETNGVSLDATDASQNDKALLYELNWLWDGEYGSPTWQEQLNQEVSVSGDTTIGNNTDDNIGNGSALLFHAQVERSADNASQKQERIDSAQAFLDQFGGGSMDCSIGEGGLTEEQAKAFMMRYGENVNNYVSSTVESTGARWKLGGCNGGGGSNCVTFSQFFDKAFTDLPSIGFPNGDLVVNSLKTAGANTGTEPRLYATFSSGTYKGEASSSYMHTGIVLGIHDGQIIVGHASCRGTGSGTGDGTQDGNGSGFILTGSLDDPTDAFLGYTSLTFAYPDNVNEAAIQEFINNGFVAE